MSAHAYPSPQGANVPSDWGNTPLAITVGLDVPPMPEPSATFRELAIVSSRTPPEPRYVDLQIRAYKAGEWVGSFSGSFAPFWVEAMRTRVLHRGRFRRE